MGWTTQAATQVTGSALSGPGLLQRPDGSLWADVRRGHGAYVQRSKHRFGTDELRARYTWLGGDEWALEFISRSRLLFGVRIWSRRIPSSAAEPPDLDHALRPTFVDGEWLVLRAPPVFAGESELRAERVYLLRRLRNRMWQDSTFKGLSDSGVFEHVN